MSGYIDTSELDSQEYQDSYDYPTPSASSDAETSTKNDAPKKKRKAWGQPVPDIVPILPPRKRAKTAEEKEQRKNERILRNRRAADKSRQRQKAAQADLEQQNKDLLVENAQLKALLQQHGLFSSSSSSVFTPPASVSAQSDPSETPISRPTPEPLTPEISQPESPSLVPELDLDQIADAPIPEHMVDALASNSYTDMMQYPAVSVGLGQEASNAPTQYAGEYGVDVDPISHDLEYLFSYNALADVSTLPNFGANIGNDLESIGINCPEQFPVDPYFDFDAFNIDTTSGSPFETSQPTSGMQSQFSASS